MGSVSKARPAEYEATVREVRRETHDTVTLLLDAGTPPPAYQAGQFINIHPHQFPALGGLTAYLEEVKGRKEPARAYSLASAPHEDHLAITLKGEEYVAGRTPYPPLLSPHLVHWQMEAARLRFMGFLGPYVLPPDVEERTDHVVHLVAGSGVVPNFSILKDALHRGLRLRHTFIDSNKTWGDIVFREQLAALEREHPERLRVVHALTREQDTSLFGPNVRCGRVCRELLEELVPDRASCLVYACGPAITPWERRKALETGTRATPRFIESVLGQLHELGIDDRRIKRETYG
jgi:3-ketosteroid 9alpha-monooxygenase subunit B